MHSKFQLKISSLFFSGLFLLTLFSTEKVLAQIVKQVKGTKILIEFPADTTVAIGDEFFVMSSQKKRTALVKLTQSKGGKALATIVKGTVQVNDTVIPRKGGNNIKGTEAVSAAKDPSFLRFDRMKLGINLKLMLNTISAKQIDGETTPNTETVSMKGTNFGLSANLDLPLAGRFIARGEGGVEMLDIKGTGLFKSCDSKTSTDCNAKITYLTLGAAGRYDFIQSTLAVWAGAGGFIKIPLSKKSTSLDESKIEMANSVYVALGADYHLSNKSFIPFSFEYHLSLNKSDTVPVIDQMNLTFGYGMMF